MENKEYTVRLTCSNKCPTGAMLLDALTKRYPFSMRIEVEADNHVISSTNEWDAWGYKVINADIDEKEWHENE